MNDVTITARFYREMQPVQYEKAGADVTVVSTSSQGKNSPADLLDAAQRAVLASLGKSHEFRSAHGASMIQENLQKTGVAVVGPAGTTQPDTVGTYPEPEKPRRGRPPKADKPAAPPTQDALEAALADAAGKPEPDAGKLAGVEDPTPEVDEAKDLPPVSDDELQTACANAAEKITANAVRVLYKNYGNVSRVAEIEQAYRRAFLKDLEKLVAEKSAPPAKVEA